MKIFKPKMYKKSVFDINYDYLKKKNINVLIFDLDNTISLINETIPNKKIENLFKKLAKDFKIIIASNSSSRRVSKFSENLRCYGYGHMLKPSKRLYRKVLKKKNINLDEVCIIGDQLLTDILLGNRLKIMTILVDPIGVKDLKVTYLNRKIEKILFKKMGIKRGMYSEEE